MYTIVFDFKSYFNEKIEDLVKELNFIPVKGMNIWFDDDEVKLPKKMENRGWFKVMDVDYLSKDNVFLIGLKDLGSFEEEN